MKRSQPLPLPEPPRGTVHTMMMMMRDSYFGTW